MTDSPGQQARAKLVAAILTDNGLEVTPPDEGTLDEAKRLMMERAAIMEAENVSEG